MTQSVHQSSNQSVSQSINQPTNQTIRQPTNQSINQSINQSSIQSNGQSANRSGDQSNIPSIKQSTNPSINQPMLQSVRQPIKQASHQSPAQAFNLPHLLETNPLNKSLTHASKLLAALKQHNPQTHYPAKLGRRLYTNLTTNLTTTAHACGTVRLLARRSWERPRMDTATLRSLCEEVQNSILHWPTMNI